MTKRFLALVLTVLMLLPAMVACASDDAGKPADSTPPAEGTQAPASTAPTSTEPEFKPTLPEVRYDGEELVIVHRSPDETYYAEIYIQAEERNGDLLNDAVYKRNTTMEEKYGIDIVSVIEALFGPPPVIAKGCWKMLNTFIICIIASIDIRPFMCGNVMLKHFLNIPAPSSSAAS